MKWSIKTKEDREKVEGKARIESKKNKEKIKKKKKRTSSRFRLTLFSHIPKLIQLFS